MTHQPYRAALMCVRRPDHLLQIFPGFRIRGSPPRRHRAIRNQRDGGYIGTVSRVLQHQIIHAAPETDFSGYRLCIQIVPHLRLKRVVCHKVIRLLFHLLHGDRQIKGNHVQKIRCLVLKILRIVIPALHEKCRAHGKKGQQDQGIDQNQTGTNGNP